MTIYYSATTNAFYDSQVYNVNNIPEDKVAVSASTYTNLMAQQCAGRVIVAAADGTPTTIAQTCGSCTSTKYATKTELTNGLAGKANDNAVVHKSGNETIYGVKSFGDIIKATNGTVQVGADTGYSVTFNYNGNITSKQPRGTYNIFFPEGSGTLALTSDIDGKANDSNVVHKTGDETINGNKTFTNQLYLGAGGGSYGLISAKDTNSILRLFGGTAPSNGANLDLYGEGLSSGGFSLRARTSDKIVGLDGKTDGTLKWNGKNVALDENLVHTSGNETIAGTKTFSDKTISNKELQYKDTKYDWSDTSLNTWCDTGHVSWLDKTGNRRMHELVGATGGVWRKACYINENQYFSVDSNRNISFWGTATFNGNIYANNNFFHKNNNIDLTVTPSSSLYTNYIFKDKNEKTLGYMQYAHNPNGIHNLGFFITDSANKLYGVTVNSAKEFLPYGDNTYSLGKNNMRWANVYATTFNGSLKGNAEIDSLIVNSDTFKHVASHNGAHYVHTLPKFDGELLGATFVKGTNYWYRKHSDGFIEMGGFTDCANAPDHMVVATNLPLAFSNTNYTLLVQMTRGTASGTSWGTDWSLPTTRSKTTTRFEVYSNDIGYPGTNGGGYNWYACGY